MATRLKEAPFEARKHWMMDALNDLVESAEIYGFPRLATFMRRLANGEDLIQIVIRGGVLMAVHGLPTDLIERENGNFDPEPFDLLDYDDLQSFHSDDDVEAIYRCAGMEIPGDIHKARDGLEIAFKRLEWQQ
jgi:hypothetical protein